MIISKKWKIESDELNVVLYELRKNKKGEQVWRAHSYYATVPNALRGFVDIKINRTGLKDLETVVSKLEELYVLTKSLTP